MDLVSLHNDSRSLVEQLAERLPDKRLAGFRSYSDAGEWDLLINSLLATLVNRQIPITTAERDLLGNLVARFDRPVNYCDFINDPDILSKLTIESSDA